MKMLSVFLASSLEEFKNERLRIGDFVRKLDDEYYPRGAFVRLIVCEEESDALVLEGKQTEYNEKIRNADLFYILIGDKVGEYTKEEYETAREAFKEKGRPEIFREIHLGS